jgi:hypothetical protein
MKLELVISHAERLAGEKALELIRSVPAWEPCDSHKLYYEVLAKELLPFIKMGLSAYPDEDITLQYYDSMITGKEFLEGLLKRGLVL